MQSLINDRSIFYLTDAPKDRAQNKVVVFSREPNCISKSYLKVLCIETNTLVGSLQKFEGAAVEFKGALGSRHFLISSPERV